MIFSVSLEKALTFLCWMVGLYFAFQLGYRLFYFLFFLISTFRKRSKEKKVADDVCPKCHGSGYVFEGEVLVGCDVCNKFKDNE